MARGPVIAWLQRLFATPADPSPTRTLLDIARTIGVLAVATLVSFAFDALGMSDTSIVIIYVLGVEVVSLVTIRRVYCLVASALAVALFNFFFIAPRLSLLAWGPQYPATLAVMFVVALASSTMAATLRRALHLSAAASHRARVLLEADRLLQACRTSSDAVEVAGTQLARLFDREVLWYQAQDGGLVARRSFKPPRVGNEGRAAGSIASAEKRDEGPVPISHIERAVAMRALANLEPAGAGTELFSSARGLYLPVRAESGAGAYGVMGIIVGDEPLNEAEASIAAAVAGEASLALGRSHALEEQERAAVLAKNEQTRANLLRSISHDLRTPLTSISGTADILLDDLAASERQGEVDAELDDLAASGCREEGAEASAGTTEAACLKPDSTAAGSAAPTAAPALDAVTRRTLLTNIRTDAAWLTATVENLLAITKVEDQAAPLETSPELLDDIIEEALAHTTPEAHERHIVVEPTDDLLLVDVNVRLVTQVIINLVNNAVTHTPPGTSVRIAARRRGAFVEATVADDGPGIPAAERERVFEPFYTAGGGAADSKRSVGLGLALCRSIVEAHGGTIRLDANDPHGCVFTFTLPAHSLTAHPSPEEEHDA